MTFIEFKESVASARLHDLAEVNAESVRADGGCLMIDFEVSAAEIERDKLLESVKELEKQIGELEAHETKLEREIEKLAEFIDEVKEEGENGATLREYSKRADDSDVLRKSWEDHARKCQDELSALRKRKGIAPGYFAAQRDIIALLQDMTRSGPIEYSERIKSIIKIIQP